MEGVAWLDFQGTKEDELSFSKGSVLKVISIDEDKDWYKAHFNGKVGYIPKNYVQMKTHDFVKKLTKAEAEAVLLEKAGAEYVQKDCAFLIHPSDSRPDEFSLAVKFEGQVQHFEVFRDGDGKYFLWVVKFDSLNELVRHHRTSSSSELKVRANYDFVSQDNGKLEFWHGEIITVVAKEDANWWTGEIVRDNKVCQGTFPKTYVTPFTG